MEYHNDSYGISRSFQWLTVDIAVVLCISQTIQFCYSPLKTFNRHLNHKHKFTKVTRNALHVYFNRPYWSRILSLIYYVLFNIILHHQNPLYIQSLCNHVIHNTEYTGVYTGYVYTVYCIKDVECTPIEFANCTAFTNAFYCLIWYFSYVHSTTYTCTNIYMHTGKLDSSLALILFSLWYVDS